MRLLTVQKGKNWNAGETIFWCVRTLRSSGIPRGNTEGGNTGTATTTAVKKAAANGVFSLPKQWQIHYGSLTFNLKPFSFKHTGLFPEQATNWDWFSEKIRNAGRPVKVLNLFAYTGGATLAAAAAGAQVTHVDASKGMVTWAKENAVSSGLKDAPIRWAGRRLCEICRTGNPQRQ